MAWGQVAGHVMERDAVELPDFVGSIPEDNLKRSAVLPGRVQR
jgi:hypothetical protein